MTQRGITLPVTDTLADFGLAGFSISAGTGIVTDPRGFPDPVTGRMVAYMVGPSTAATWSMIRIDLESRSWTTLRQVPVAPGGGVYNTAIMATVYDPNGGVASNEPSVYVLISSSLNPFCAWYQYNILTDGWVLLNSPNTGAVPGTVPLATSVSLCHPCNTLGTYVALNANISDDYIYANGDGGQWGAAGVSRLAQFRKSTGAWTYLTGVGGLRGGAPAAGSQCVWLPSNAGVIFTTRGGGGPQWDVYNFVGNAWSAAFVPAPQTQFFDAGSEITTVCWDHEKVAVRSANQSTMVFTISGNDLVTATTGAYRFVCSADGADGTLHASNTLFTWSIGGKNYIGLMQHGGSVVQRIRVIE